MRLIRRFAVAFVAISLSSVLFAQKLTVAITIDDLPFVAPDRSAATLAVTDALALTANQKLLAALSRHHVPVTGFVIQKSSEELGPGVGAKILQEWVDDGLDLGNHSYSHPNFDDISIAEMEADITRGEGLYAPLMKAAHREPKFFRFPYNHTGDTKEKHDALAAFLAKHGYTLAPCTIENEDWVFSAAYHIMVSRHDDVAAAKLRADYLAFTAAQIDYFAALHRQVLGYEPPQIMLIHDNQLNGDVIDQLLTIFEQKQYGFVTLSQAEADPIYRTPETHISSYGPMWGYRWAKERGVKVDGSLEPEPPKWITAYGK